MKGITREQIKHGLNKVAEKGLEWPPNAAVFRKMCLDQDKCTDDIGRQAHKSFQRLLPIPEEERLKRRKTGRKELDKMLDLLR